MGVGSTSAASPRWLEIALIAALCLTGCVAGSWRTNRATFVNEQQVASALNDGVASATFEATSVPNVNPPEHVRPCCAFGMDLQMSLGSTRVPGYSVSNIIGLTDLGQHEYDNGMVTFNQELGRLVTVEKNGLVLTCRGGFIDTAHVRDNADLTLFLATKIVLALPNAAAISFEGDGSVRRVILRPIPADLIEGLGRWEVAITLAQWAAFQISIWHELITWYGYESYSGFSEKLSAFSPEDFYSNAVGMKIAAGILREQRVRSRADWDASIDAWIPATLFRLVALPPELGKRAMKALDGHWWDSNKRIPDFTLVTRRNYGLGPAIAPWRVFDAQFPSDPALEEACRGRSTPLPLVVPERLGGVPISELAAVEFDVGGWAPANFPFPAAPSRRVSSTDFPKMAEEVRRDAEKSFGVGFDQPGPKPGN